MTKREQDFIDITRKLSDLVGLATEDGAEVSKDNRYKRSMSFWHTNFGLCYVCMAGGIIAKTLMKAPTENFRMSDFPDLVRQRLGLLEDLRAGYGAWHKDIYGLDLCEVLHIRDICGWAEICCGDLHAWKKFAKLLKEAGM